MRLLVNTSFGGNMIGVLRHIWNQFASKMLDFPPDVIGELPRITMMGNLQMYMENHRGIIRFTDQLLVLRIAAGRLEITGEQLIIKAISKDEVYVTGKIIKVHYIMP